LILDDYGMMPGARKAVDEYFSSAATPILLQRVNFTVYAGIKS
jgi:hypothetical protein